MATNQFFESSFNAPREDQRLVEDLIVEAIQIHGRDFFYLPRTLNNFDSFFGEDQASTFKDVGVVEMIMTNMTSWEGQGPLLGKFGLEDRDEATVQVSIKRFREEILRLFPEIIRPREGDIIFMPGPYDDQTRAFEIMRVEKEQPFYQLGGLYVWTMTVKNFEYSGEKFDTGIKEIDVYEDASSLATEILVGNGVGDYVPGESVSQLSGWSAQVVFYTGNKLILTKISGDLRDDEPIMGDTSMASRYLQSVETEVGNDSGTSDNDFVYDRVTSGGLIDFSESNPFTG